MYETFSYFYSTSMIDFELYNFSSLKTFYFENNPSLDLTIIFFFHFSFESNLTKPNLIFTIRNTINQYNYIIIYIYIITIMYNCICNIVLHIANYLGLLVCLITAV